VDQNRGRGRVDVGWLIDATCVVLTTSFLSASLAGGVSLPAAVVYSMLMLVLLLAGMVER
jgi:hypothetical protein